MNGKLSYLFFVFVIFNDIDELNFVVFVIFVLEMYILFGELMDMFFCNINR